MVRSLLDKGTLGAGGWERIRWSRFSRCVGCSWRVDETYIAIKGNWHYLYRAVDKHGRTVDFLLRPDRGIAAAQAFFRKALASHTDHPPLKITLDGHWHSHRALHLLRREHAAWRRVRVRSSKYLNNIVEQDHRAIKQRCGPMRGFKSFANAVTVVALQTPFRHKYLKQRFLDGVGFHRGHRERARVCATGPVRTPQDRVKERATRIRIDLYQFGPVTAR